MSVTWEPEAEQALSRKARLQVHYRNPAPHRESCLDCVRVRCGQAHCDTRHIGFLLTHQPCRDVLCLLRGAHVCHFCSRCTVLYVLRPVFGLAFNASQVTLILSSTIIVSGWILPGAQHIELLRRNFRRPRHRGLEFPGLVSHEHECARVILYHSPKPTVALGSRPRPWLNGRVVKREDTDEREPGS